MRWYWALWLLVGFGVPELLALARHRGQDTLSEAVWRWFDVLPGQTVWQWKAAHVLLAAIMVWLSFHMVFRLWR